MLGEWWRCGPCGGPGRTVKTGWTDAEIAYDHEATCPLIVVHAEGGDDDGGE